jgi:hypothetical protein
LALGRTVTIEGGVGSGSPFEKWMVARITKAATMRAKTTVRRTGSILARLGLLLLSKVSAVCSWQDRNCR